MKIRILALALPSGNKVLKKAFRGKSEFSLRLVSSSKALFARLGKTRPHAVVLSEGPLSTASACAAHIRKHHQSFGGVVLSLVRARNEAEVVSLFQAGVDEVLPFPCPARELFWRIVAVTRRLGATAPKTTRATNPPSVRWTLDAGAHALKRNAEEIHLTREEFQLLESLSKARGRVLTRRFLLETLWGDPSAVNSEMIDALVSRLRRKLGPGHRDEIKTVYGVGYSFQHDYLKS